jgi:hypothetical protein
VNEESKTIQAIVEASNYPLSIVVVGVGTHPRHLWQYRRIHTRVLDYHHQMVPAFDQL